MKCWFVFLTKKIANEIKEKIKSNNEKNKKKTTYITKHDLDDILS